MAKTYSFPIPRALPLGLSASCILLLASFSGGATRNRGGLLEALNIGFLSYGHGRNLGLALYWVGIFLLAAAWVLAGRTIIRPQLKNPLPEGGLRDIQRILIAWVAPLLLAGPLASRDVYSYLMQGAMVRDGFDPYTEGAAVNPGPFLLEVSQDWRNTTTPYGPLHLWIGELVTSLVGDNVTAGIVVYKALSLLGFIAIAWSIPQIARKLGADPTVALWLGVANPVIILHLLGGMHNESLMVGLVSIGLLAALNRRFHAALLLVGAAVAMKATALIAAPFIVWMMLHYYAPKGSSAWRSVFVFAVSGIAAVVEIIAAVALITWVSGTSWGWLSQISGNSKVINPLAGPTLATDVIFPAVQIFTPDASYNAILAVLRSIATACMFIGLVAVWWMCRKNNRDAIMGTAAAYQVAFVFNAVTLPWYYASIFTLMGTFRPPLWLLKFTTGVALFIGVSFSGDGNHQLYNWFWVIGMIVVAWFATQWLFEGVPKKQQPARGE
ncbi:alpha-(1-_6)-mannopyranosyltransferase A [Corynebacterium sp. c8Ua_181]|uniref:Alpha-(1->6)-mannopyranosyltransferase A n=1 Tax=Corynebacterium curieae TaxID=2913500 RepID=A0A9X3RRN2_9CORY|nr:alpha-(1->6)-mannopyranosyltransferase A [Corynebacterium curieae]MCZ9306319.1 alpha-(1->6)-mannopyranosyltransferase A [Corynebacterium curieae]MDV2423084.1 alpha-(1->6)-mannopyranosyltransferase A [Corynebacterium curieae]